MRRLFGMMMLVLAAGTVSPVAVAAVHQPGSPGPGRFGARLVDVPVSEAGNPRALRYIVDYLPVGTVIHRRILIVNQELRTGRFSVYADAAQIVHGAFTGDAGATRSELTSWITVQHATVTLRPGASVMDMVTIAVPHGATRGEQYGVIWVQQAAYVRTASGFGVNDVVRVGIRVYLAVSRGGVPPTNFTITSVTGRRSAAGRPSIVVHVADTGGRAVDVNGTARLAGGPGGTSAGPFRGRQVLTLAPGQSGDVTFALPKDLPNGPWQATVTVVSGFTLRTATASIQFAALRASHPGSGLPVWAWIGIALAAVVIAAIVAFVLARLAARRRAPEMPRPEKAARS